MRLFFFRSLSLYMMTEMIDSVDVYWNETLYRKFKDMFQIRLYSIDLLDGTWYYSGDQIQVQTKTIDPSLDIIIDPSGSFITVGKETISTSAIVMRIPYVLFDIYEDLKLFTLFYVC